VHSFSNLSVSAADPTATGGELGQKLWARSITSISGTGLIISVRSRISNYSVRRGRFDRPRRSFWGKQNQRHFFWDFDSIPRHYGVSEYVSNPLCIDGFKFDLRVYVLMTSFASLRAFLYAMVLRDLRLKYIQIIQLWIEKGNIGRKSWNGNWMNYLLNWTLSFRHQKMKMHPVVHFRP
jgi:hypothetical protein